MLAAPTIFAYYERSQPGKSQRRHVRRHVKINERNALSTTANDKTVARNQITWGEGKWRNSETKEHHAAMLTLTARAQRCSQINNCNGHAITAYAQTTPWAAQRHVTTVKEKA
jgi:hypothetical protein